MLLACCTKHEQITNGTSIIIAKTGINFFTNTPPVLNICKILILICILTYLYTFVNHSRSTFIHKLFKTFSALYKYSSVLGRNVSRFCKSAQSFADRNPRYSHRIGNFFMRNCDNAVMFAFKQEPAIRASACIKVIESSCDDKSLILLARISSNSNASVGCCAIMSVNRFLSIIITSVFVSAWRN